MVACKYLDMMVVDEGQRMPQGLNAYHDQASNDADAKSTNVIARGERRYLGAHLRRQRLLLAAP